MVLESIGCRNFESLNYSAFAVASRSASNGAIRGGLQRPKGGLGAVRGCRSTQQGLPAPRPKNENLKNIYDLALLRTGIAVFQYL